MRFKKSFRKMLAMAIAAGTFAVMPLASAEVKEYEGFGEYVMSDFETPDTAKQRAKERAEQNAMEQAGVYLESCTEVVNARITKDEIKTITNGILKVKDVKYVMSPISESGGSFQIIATLKATIDTDGIQDWLQRDEKDKKDLVEQNQELMKTNAEQEQQIAELKRKLATTSDIQDRKKIGAEIENSDQSFLAKQKVNEGLRKFYDKDYWGAIALYMDAIELNPQYADAYCKRGIAESRLKLYTAACESYDTAISLEPDNINIYLLRGMTYAFYLEDYYRGIHDFSIVIQKDNRNEFAYSARGGVYASIGEYMKAIDDYSIAIKINPKNGMNYSFRANSYSALGLYEKAIADRTNAINLDNTLVLEYKHRAQDFRAIHQYSKAISDLTIAIKIYPQMVPDFAMSIIGTQLYTDRAVTYSLLGNAKEAILDYTRAIQLDSNNAIAYYGRSIVYEAMGNYQQANADKEKAKELGYTE